MIHTIELTFDKSHIITARLLTQELALMKEPRSAKRAFVLQGKLLRDAFVAHDRGVDVSSP